MMENEAFVRPCHGGVERRLGLVGVRSARGLHCLLQSCENNSRGILRGILDGLRSKLPRIGLMRLRNCTPGDNSEDDDGKYCSTKHKQPGTLALPCFGVVTNDAYLNECVFAGGKLARLGLEPQTGACELEAGEQRI